MCTDECLHPGCLPRETQHACLMQDHSLRLWNLETQVCVCTMVGDGAHTNEVLSVVRPYLIIMCVTGHQVSQGKMVLPALQRPLYHQCCNACSNCSVLPCSACNVDMCLSLAQQLQICKQGSVGLQDFHASDGNKLLSAGMDHTIKMWNLQGWLTLTSLPCNCLRTHAQCHRFLMSWTLRLLLSSTTCCIA